MTEEAQQAVTQNQEGVGTIAETTTTAPDPKKQVIHTVQNPTEDEVVALRASIEEKFPTDVITTLVNFNFKKSTDKDTGIETIRTPVQLVVPYPSAQGIVAILEMGPESKELQLLMEAIETVVNSAARDIIADDVNLNAATFPVDKISWTAIAHMPKAQRRGGGIPKEVWEAFATDYMDVMPEATGKNMEQVGRAVKLFMGKLAQVKTNKPVLAVLMEQLTIYVNASDSIEDFQECIAFLVQKADTFLNTSDEDLIANL